MPAPSAASATSRYSASWPQPDSADPAAQQRLQQAQADIAAGDVVTAQELTAMLEGLRRPL